MDLCYYFVRRGSENIYNWTKNTFKIKTDDAIGITYIEKVKDELSKNHQEVDSEIITAFMPEQRGSRMCPVLSFTTYLSALNPKNDKLWQAVRFEKFHYDDKVWYGPGPLGQNSLDSFITKLAEKVGMKEKGYSNHSIHVSGITELTRNQFTNKQIMSISGHKSQDSLAIFQKVNANEKLRMGLTLGFALLNKPQQQIPIAQAQIQSVPSLMPAIPMASTATGLPSKPQMCITEPQAKKAKLVYEEEDPIPSNVNLPVAIPQDDFKLSDQELINLINDTSDNMQMTQYNEVTSKEGTMKQIVQKKTSPRPPIFNNCTFSGNVTININK